MVRPTLRFSAMTRVFSPGLVWLSAMPSLLPYSCAASSSAGTSFMVAMVGMGWDGRKRRARRSANWEGWTSARASRLQLSCDIEALWLVRSMPGMYMRHDPLGQAYSPAAVPRLKSSWTCPRSSSLDQSST